MMNIREYLISKGVHPSQQRLAIMDYLMKHRTHPTADEIFTALLPSMPTLSRTTVYNTLKVLVEHNAILNINIEEKNARFDGCTDNHAHFLCEQCGAIYDIDLPESPLSDNSSLADFDITSTQIYFKGLCPKCKTHVK